MTHFPLELEDEPLFAFDDWFVLPPEEDGAGACELPGFEPTLWRFDVVQDF
jgi:hypothetical protein